MEKEIQDKFLKQTNIGEGFTGRGHLKVIKNEKILYLCMYEKFKIKSNMISIKYRALDITSLEVYVHKDSTFIFTSVPNNNGKSNIMKIKNCTVEKDKTKLYFSIGECKFNYGGF